MRGRRSRLLVVLFLVVTGVLIWTILPRDKVSVIDVRRLEPGAVTLTVASCNAAPEASVTGPVDGRYRVDVRTTKDWERGNACADLVEVAVDPTLRTLEIHDEKSGEVFGVPAPAVDEPLDIDGLWEMVVVNGESVLVGVNTEETPAIEIRAGFLSGNLGCNAVGVELLQDVDVLRAFGFEGTEELCGIPDGSDEMVLTERILRTMLESGDGVEVTRSNGQMTWLQGSNQVVFELG